MGIILRGADGETGGFRVVGFIDQQRQAGRRTYEPVKLFERLFEISLVLDRLV
jgi:hypothetical protein